jgi:hypothetical protein
MPAINSFPHLIRSDDGAVVVSVMHKDQLGQPHMLSLILDPDDYKYAGNLEVHMDINTQSVRTSIVLDSGKKKNVTVLRYLAVKRDGAEFVGYTIRAKSKDVNDCRQINRVIHFKKK